MENRFDDNIMVQRHKWGVEFLAIMFAEVSDDWPCPVTLYRYCLPGRIDTYHFDYVPGGCGHGWRIRYYAELDGGRSLPEVLKLLAIDLDRPQVVKMLREACVGRRYFARQLVENLLAYLAPRSKSIRACRQAMTQKE